MKQQQTGLLLLGAFFVAIVLAAIAYFVFISGELDRGTTAREDAEIARNENELLQLQIQQMQARAQNVPEWQEQIALISLDIPPRLEQPEFERLLTAQMDEAGLPVVSVSYGEAVAVDPTTLETLVPEPLPLDDGEAEPTPSATPTPAPTSDGGDGAQAPQAPEEPSAPFAGLYAIPVDITTEGDGVAALDFIKSMDEQLTRFFTVTRFTVGGAEATEEQPGRPELVEGDWTVELSGLIFVLLDDARSFVIDEPGPVPEYTPGGGVLNPLEPLPGTESGDAE